MASNTQKAKRVRKRKKAPNKMNLKTDMKREQQNRAVLKELGLK